MLDTGTQHSELVKDSISQERYLILKSMFCLTGMMLQLKAKNISSCTQERDLFLTFLHEIATASTVTKYGSKTFSTTSAAKNISLSLIFKICYG